MMRRPGTSVGSSVGMEHAMRRFPARAWALAALLLPWPLLGTSPAAAANVVLLLMDDAAASDAAGMPTLRRLAREGATFDHAYTPSPMCAPSRAIIHSGQYSQNNGLAQTGYRKFVASGAISRPFAVARHRAVEDNRIVRNFI